MKTLIAIAALAALAVPAVASAQVALPAVIGNVGITGKVDARCSFVTSSATIALGEMADSTTGAYNLAADGKSETLSGWCNGLNSNMTVASTAITRTGGGVAPTGFDNVVNFLATAVVTPAVGAAVSASDSTTDVPSGAAAVKLFSGDIVVTLTNSATPNGGKLIAGAYTGNVAVTLTPAL